MENKKHLGLVLEPEIHAKLKSLAKYNGLSINQVVNRLIKKAILNHEKKYGPLI